ncbi:leukemia inhibitory factor receptor [Varanus komodoensis]|uniref:LIF receptor subunit alpha n=1 Tax=Varanus komodoensis TaxID=61221 RepID=A0A8D2J655_VARKO|nr:leukemia inhibitory factor receptor [Varanus komodoensis]
MVNCKRMWINRVPCCLLAVAHLYLLNHLAHSQETDSSHQLQNFTCVTQDFNDVNCTWIEASTDDFGYSYKFCYTASTSSTTECSVTEDKRATLKLFSFNSVRIEITTLHSSGGVGSPIATNSFLLTEKNISFIPPTPKIHSLTPNYITDKLDLEWYDGGSAFPYEIDATWEIQILRKDPMVEVALKTYHSKLTRKNTLLHWTWTSDLPFNCTTHYVRIRCFLHENAFAGSKKWSEWSQIESIPGHDTGFFEAVYPTDRVVPVGSNITFCCVVQNGHTWTDLKYSSCPPQNCPIEILSKWSISIHAPNVQFHEPSGNNAWCLIKNSTTPPPGTVLFVGLPPDIPRNLTCETHNFKDIRCKWEEGRSTFLSGLRKTIYTLSERISGGNVTYTGESEHYQCTYPVSNNQTIYNFTVYASNSLGQSEASLQIDIRHRVHPRTPADLTVTDNGPTNLILSWNLPGSFKGIKLQCEVQVSTSNSREKLKKNLDGAENSRYTISVDTLHPYTVYNFQVRCAAAEPFFWKWSTWSKEAQHETQQAPPAGRLDVWREKSADGETVTIFWKPLPILERNGLIEGHKVSCSLPKMTMQEFVPVAFNSTKVKLGKNDCVLAVVAKNKAGFSRPSLINSAEIPAGEDAPVENGVATGDGISVAWRSDPSVTCGYTVRWCPGPKLCTAVDWETFPSNVTNAVIKSVLFQPGVRYRFSVYGCKEKGYQLLKYVDGYIQELSPRVPPVFNVETATSDSILIKWKDIPVEDLRGFLKGYLLHYGKGEEGNTKLKDFESRHPARNITDPKQNSFRIPSLQGKTSYHLILRGYTEGGIGPARSLYVVTKENAVGLIIAIIIPVAIVVALAAVTSFLCYQKREWIKETFYPDIPNPENCKALEFEKDLEGNPNCKTLEMNPCTPNNIEVVEKESPCLKIEDTAITSPAVEEHPEDGFDSETESHIVVSYCPPIIEEEISHPPGDESAGSSQVIYIDIQSMYPAQVKPKEELEVDCVAAAGYKPQMQLPVTSLRKTEEASSIEEDLDKAAGYRPQVNRPSWITGCPDSPGSMESNNENASFGSPCSINSRQFLIPPKEDEDSPKAINSGWSFTNLFHTKPND